MKNLSSRGIPRTARDKLRNLFLLLLVFLTSCGSAEYNQGEDFGNLLTTTAGLTLSEPEHRTGWGNAECTLCHNLENIHLENRTGTNLDIVAIHDQAIANGISGCAACHGTNGVP